MPVGLHPTAVAFAAIAAWFAWREVAEAKVYDGPAWARAVAAGGPWLMTPTAPAMGWAIAAAIGGALVVLGSLLLSGLAHLAAARRAGVRPTRMRLFFLGGEVACAEGEPSREHSALEAAAGPLVTAVLALAGWAATGGLFGEAEPHSQAALVGSVLLRTCALFNALMLVAILVLLLVWLLPLARRR